MSDLEKISSLFDEQMAKVKSKEELQNLKTDFFGKNGKITLQFKTLGSLNEKKRKEFASELNKLKDKLNTQIDKKTI